MLDERTTDAKPLELTLTGPLYVNEVQALREGLIRCIDDGNKRLSLDFSQVEYLDCSGIGALVCVHKRARERGGQLVIKGVQGRIRYLFERTRLDKTLLIL